MNGVYVLLILMAYLFGSLSSAIIVCKVMGKPDPRTAGSQNPGATNVLRVAGKLPGALTLIGDVLKGLLPVLIVQWWLQQHHLSLAVLLAATIGHLYPVFFKFKGGKGVATALGGVIGFSLLLAGIFAATWLIVVGITRFVSLASMLGFIVLPVASGFLYGWHEAVFFAIIAMIIVIRHRGNVERLCHRQEPKLF